MHTSYNPNEIEPKWQSIWEETNQYQTHEIPGRPKYYCLDFFPYPSGDGLHVGHCRNYVPTDVISRVKRMQGYNVLHPMGWDAFGEPAEQYAIANNVHPRITTDKNTANYKRQFDSIGISYDWSREIDSSKSEFYRWTQWFFLIMYRRGLAYHDVNWQWWCPICQTTLSNNEVTGGVCWRGHSGVFKRQVPAWYFRITDYAEELISGLDDVDWPDSIKAMQRNWIGRSEGTKITFELARGKSINVFTTRPDTLYGVTYLALAPEHTLVDFLTVPERRSAVDEYKSISAQYGEIDRMMENHDKTGIFSGSFAVHPLTGENLPIWIADYVLPGYGGGAVMGVPAHDARDFDFAGKYGLPVKTVITPPGVINEVISEAYIESGLLINSDIYTGLSNEIAGLEITSELEKRGLGEKLVVYRMRDWLISRQRYWGTPIPIIYCDDCGEVPVPVDKLPVELPYLDSYQPDGSGLSSLARSSEFLNTHCPTCGSPAKRETDTMGGFACSAWYYMRFTSPNETNQPFDPKALEYWMPVDLYVGGAEHAVLHLLYARFWTKVLADEGLISFREPFTVLKNQGQLLAPDGSRMSKSRRNTITPDDMVKQYGADALRVYEMFMAPFDQDIMWNTAGISGARRFLNRVWKLYQDSYTGMQDGVDSELKQELHRAIHRVSERIEQFRFNTMISALMEFTNLLIRRKQEGRWQTQTFRQALDVLLLLLAPEVPHLAEELWSLTGHNGSVHAQSWPVWDSDLIKLDVIEIPVQVNGKVKEVIMLPHDLERSAAEVQIMALPKIAHAIDGRKVIKTIYIPGKFFNIVTKP